MASGVQRYFEISLLLMLGIAFATLATTGKLDLPSIIVLSGGLLARLWRRDILLSHRTVTLLAAAYIPFYALDLLVLSSGAALVDRMLSATVHLILFTAVIKIFSARTYRDYGYLATLSFLMMLAAAILTVSTNYLVGLLVYLLFATSTFVSYEVKRSAEEASFPPPKPEGEPGKLHDDRETRGTDRGSSRGTGIEKALLGTTLGLTVANAVLAAILFYVIPRYHTSYFTAISTHSENVTGFSESVSLGDLRNMKRSRLVVMRVVVEGNPRNFEGVKWRGVGLTSFDGRHWYQDNTAQTAITAAVPQHFMLPLAEGWQRRPRHTLRYRVQLAALSTDVLFAAAVTREVGARLRVVAVDQTDSLHNPLHAENTFDYDAVSESGLPPASDLRHASTSYPQAIRLVYLNLPPLDPHIPELAREITARDQSNYDRASSLESYLRHNFTYTLNPTSIEPGDPIGSFLFKSRQGYCEYFATTMALMLRTVGIPSRLVNGFQTGTYNRFGHDYIVRAQDAHSWVEAYFPEYGWIPFDPTPADPNAAEASGALDDYLDALGLFWNEWVINYDFSHQEQLASDVEQRSRRFQRKVQFRFDRFRGRGLELARAAQLYFGTHKLLLSALALLILAAILIADRFTGAGLPLREELRFRWAWLVRRNQAVAGSIAATLTYREFLKAMAVRGFHKGVTQTPREFALSLHEKAPKVLEFTRLYNDLRYGQSMVSVAELRRMIEEI